MGSLHYPAALPAAGGFPLSDLFRTTNLVKAKRDVTWLTPSQRQALTALRGLLCVPCCVNLYGPVGVGKTFLAWNLADELGYAYLAHPTLIRQAEHLETKGVIVDSVEAGRMAHRDMLKLLSFQEISRAILITRQVVQDYTYCVELTLTPEDQAHVRENLAGIGIFRPAIGSLNLWVLINPALAGGRDA